MFFSRRINNFQVERRIFSVVVREEGFEENIIYCKGSPEDMFDKLKDKELKKNILENKLSLFKNSKAEIIVYGKRVLSNS
jgi:magnesium-transporting ATPase (P-type)